MAKKAKNPGQAPGTTRRTIVEERVEEGPGPDELSLLPDEPDEGDGDFLGVLSDLAGGSEGQCEIRRTSPSEFAGYCCTYALSEMSLDRLQSEWGGGKFSVRLRLPGGQFKGSVNVQVAGRPKNREDAAPVVSAPAPAPAVDLAGVVAAVNAANQGQINMLSELVKGLIARPEPAKGPDVLEVVTALAPILKPDRRDEGGSSADAVKLLMQGIELGKDLAGGGGSGDTFTDLALKGMDMVKSVAASIPAPRQVARPAQRQPPPARLAPPARGPAPGTVPAQEAAAAPEVVNPESPPMLKLLGWIKQQAHLLVHQAKRGKNPALYAELFLDNLPDGVTLEAIYERMEKADAVDELAEITGNAEILQHRPWFDQFRAEVLALMTDDEDDEAEEAAPGVNGSGSESAPQDAGGDSPGNI